MRICLAIVLFAAFSSPSFAATIYVPDDFSTIQEAIDAAANGDTVIVRPGSYFETIDFVGKAITLKSEKGASVTTIDGNNIRGSIVSFLNDEGADSILDGFTLMNCGLVFGGGGIWCLSSSPAIRNNIITDNISDWNGGGILCEDQASPLIKGNIISNNEAYYAAGGGGIACVFDSSPVISNNIISGNLAYEVGGGICCSDSSPVISNNIIYGNTADLSGGGIHCHDSSPVIINNIILWNHTNYGGGGISCYYASATITNNTIVENRGYFLSGGIECHYAPSPTITNTILWNRGSEIDIYESNPTVTYCNVEGGWSGEGNIDADPLFVQPTGDDYHLTFNSPCKDAGDNSAAVLPSEDCEGDPRIHGGTVDIGADEFHLHLYPVGDIIPGSQVRVMVLGTPGTMPITLALGSGIFEPPQSTPFGNLYLRWPIVGRIPMRPIGPHGVSFVVRNIPSDWLPGEKYPFQALAGIELTNLMVLTVK